LLNCIAEVELTADWGCDGELKFAAAR